MQRQRSLLVSPRTPLPPPRDRTKKLVAGSRPARPGRMSGGCYTGVDGVTGQLIARRRSFDRVACRSRSLWAERSCVVSVLARDCTPPAPLRQFPRTLTQRSRVRCASRHIVCRRWSNVRAISRCVRVCLLLCRPCGLAPWRCPHAFT